MAKKRQSKHTRKAAKQQRSTPHAPRVAPLSAQTRPAIKISEAILTLALAPKGGTFSPQCTKSASKKCFGLDSTDAVSLSTR